MISLKKSFTRKYNFQNFKSVSKPILDFITAGCIEDDSVINVIKQDDPGHTRAYTLTRKQLEEFDMEGVIEIVITTKTDGCVQVINICDEDYQCKGVINE